MNSIDRSKRVLLLLLISYGMLIVMSLSRVVEAEQTPWRWVVGGLAIGFLSFGPISWLTVTRLSRRSVVALTTVALLGGVVLVGFLEGFFDVALHASALGIYVGFFLAFLTEVTLLPGEYRFLVPSL